MRNDTDEAAFLTFDSAHLHHKRPVRAGFSRKTAEELSAAVVLGTAKLKQESTEHPIALMDSICSPGGTTIEGVLKLKELGFESAVHQGIQAIIDKDSRI